jgi:hypothetical protein
MEPRGVVISFDPLRMEQSTGNAVKLNDVPENKTNPRRSGLFQSVAGSSSLTSNHQSEHSAPRPNGKMIAATEIGTDCFQTLLTCAKSSSYKQHENDGWNHGIHAEMTRFQPK